MAHAPHSSHAQPLAVAPASLHLLHDALARALGAGAAPAMQEAGYATGQAQAAMLRGWLARQDGASLESLPLDSFADRLAAFFREQGWGVLALRTSGAVSVVEAREWAEWRPRPEGEPPTCHFTTGMLAGLFGALAEHPLAVLEVEPAQAEDGACRFLIGNERVLNDVFDRLQQGESVESALHALTVAGAALG